MKRVFLAALLPFSLSTVPAQAQSRGNNDSEHLQVPGGLSAQKRNAMWLAAKLKCYDLSYDDIKEDKEASVLICRHDKLSQIMRFSQDGVTLTSPTTGFTKVPLIGGLWSKPKKDRLRLRNAMAVAAGLPEVEK